MVRYLRAALGADAVSGQRTRTLSSCRGGALARPFSLPARKPAPAPTHSSAPAAARPPAPSTARASAPVAWHIGLSFLLMDICIIINQILIPVNREYDQKIFIRKEFYVGFSGCTRPGRNDPSRGLPTFAGNPGKKRPG